MHDDAEKDFFARVDALFQAAIELDERERRVLLDNHDEDPDVIAEVRALLAEDAAGAELEAIVDRGLQEAATDGERSGEEATDETKDARTRTLDHDVGRDVGRDVQTAREPVPAAIGPYQILGSLGRGGLATVYLAERASEFSMPVALKRIRRGLDTDDIVERLRLERQILARLVHPNIARLHDGGSDESGQPYLVMEVIEGRRIDEYCAERSLSTRARLELFRQACEAVDFAHQNLILHRDLKPSNILVTEDGTLKLLDFGIAKVLAGAQGEIGSQQTATGKRLLTPDYASPEQLAGEPLTTASDIYSLGIVLFQLITGRLPHELTPSALWTGRRGDAPLASRTAHQERRSGNALTPPVDRWSTSTETEIDAILAKALESEPGRRYGSVRELDEDIHRLLDDRPVLARRPTLRYRLGKLARRHRALVTLGALALISLLVGIVGTSWQARVADRERGRAEEERVRAEQERVRAEKERARAEEERGQAEAVADFLVELFDVSDPYGEGRLVDPSLDLVKPRAQSVTARELLDAAALRISGDLAGDAFRQSRLRRAIARAYFGLGLFAETRQLLEAAERDLAELAAASPESAGIAVERALVQGQLGRLDAREGRFDAASRRLPTAVQTLRRLGAEKELAESLEYLGELEYWQEHTEAAERHYREVLDLQRRLHGERSLEVAGARAGLAKVLNRAQRYDEMEALLQQSLDVRRQRLGADHPLVLETQNDLALVVMVRDKPAAEAIFRDLIQRQQRVLGEEHADLISTHFNHAVTLEHLDRLPEAEAAITHAWRVAESSSATETPLAADVLLLQGQLDEQSGELRDAARHYETALALHRRLYGDRHAETLIALLRLARVLVRLGDGRAEPYLREALTTSEQLGLGLEDSAYLGLGELRLAQERWDEAEALLRRGLEALESEQGGEPDGWPAGILELRLAQALTGRARQDGARRGSPPWTAAHDVARQAEARLRASLGADRPWNVEARALLEELENW